MQFGDLKVAEVMWLRHLWSVLAHPKTQMYQNFKGFVSSHYSFAECGFGTE